MWSNLNAQLGNGVGPVGIYLSSWKNSLKRYISIKTWGKAFQRAGNVSRKEHREGVGNIKTTTTTKARDESKEVRPAAGSRVGKK